MLSRWQVVGLLLVVVLSVVCACLIYGRKPPPDPKGAAYAACRGALSQLLMYQVTAGVGPIVVTELPPPERRRLVDCLRYAFLPSKTKLLLCRTFDWRGPGSTDSAIAIVCDRALSEPKYLFWHSAPRHVVAYQNGSVGDISEEDFRQLDLREFIDVALLEAPDPQRQ